jgi:hypothetical protein
MSDRNRQFSVSLGMLFALLALVVFAATIAP